MFRYVKRNEGHTFVNNPISALIFKWHSKPILSENGSWFKKSDWFPLNLIIKNTSYCTMSIRQAIKHFVTNIWTVEFGLTLSQQLRQ